MVGPSFFAEKRLGDLRLGRVHELGKRLGIVDRQVRQDLAVDLDARELQAVDEAAVGQTVGTNRRVDARDPQLAEVALAQTAPDIGVAQGAGDLLGRSAVLLGLRPEVALGMLVNLPAALLGVDRLLNSGQCFLPPLD